MPCQAFCSLMFFWNILALVHGPSLSSVVWECVRENDLFLVGTSHWSQYIKGLGSTSTQKYLEFRTSRHWYTHALIIKSRHLASCFVGHMLFAPASLWLLYCDSVWHFKLCRLNCLGHYKLEEPSPRCFTVFLFIEFGEWENGAVYLNNYMCNMLIHLSFRGN